MIGLYDQKLLLHPVAHSQLIEEEFRSQNSGIRINQSGIQTRDFLVDHQIADLVGVLNPVIHPPFRSKFILLAVAGRLAHSDS